LKRTDILEHRDEARSLDRRLVSAIGLNALIVVAEVVGGRVSGSLALLSDAVHNLSDGVALVIAFVARRLGTRPPSHRHTYGLGRVEVLAGLFNSATILVVGTLIIRSAVTRLMYPRTRCLPVLCVAVERTPSQRYKHAGGDIETVGCGNNNRLGCSALSAMDVKQ